MKEEWLEKVLQFSFLSDCRDGGDEDVFREDVFQGRQSRADFLVRSSSGFQFLCWAAKGAVFFITACNYSAVAADREWSWSSFPPADTWMLPLVWAFLLQLSVPTMQPLTVWLWELSGKFLSPLLPEGKGKSLPSSAASQFISGALQSSPSGHRSWAASACQAPQLSRQYRVNLAVCSWALHMCWTDHIWLL